jgi:hypothetical protein
MNIIGVPPGKSGRSAAWRVLPLPDPDRGSRVERGVFRSPCSGFAPGRRARLHGALRRTQRVAFGSHRAAPETPPASMQLSPARSSIRPSLTPSWSDRGAVWWLWCRAHRGPRPQPDGTGRTGVRRGRGPPGAVWAVVAFWRSRMRTRRAPAGTFLCSVHLPESALTRILMPGFHGIPSGHTAGVRLTVKCLG